MTEKNQESPQDPRKRFKELLDKVEKSEEEAQKLAKQMEDNEAEGDETRTGDQEAGHEDKDMTPSSPPGESLSRPGEDPAVKGEEPPEGVREEIPAAEQDTADRMQEDGEPGPGQAPAGSEEIRESEPGITEEEDPSIKGEYEGLVEEDIPPGEESPTDHEAGNPAPDQGREGAVEEEDPSLRKTIYFEDTPSKPPSWVESPGVKEQGSLNGAGDEFPEPGETKVIKEPDPPPRLEETPPPPLGETPHTPPPALDTRGMPLPRRMDEPQQKGKETASQALPAEPGEVSPLAQKWKGFKRWWTSSGPGSWNWSRGLGCFLRMAVISAFVFVILAIVLGSFGMYHYNRVASSLPDVDNLREQAAQFETTRILDREGGELYEILDPNAGRRTYVPLEEISPYLVAATIATEDSHFYSHPGYDIFAIARAFWSNLVSDEIVSGASTITQQLTRILLFSPEERTRQTYTRKLREAILAAEITRRYSKDEILELYLNEIYYGNLSYGVEAAAETYFRTSAKKLDLAQASFLAGIPQLPSIYDIYTNRELTLNRHEQVLVSMYQASQEQGCIYVSNNQQGICISAGDAASAAEKIQEYEFKAPQGEMRYPHWVNYVRSLLEDRYEAQTIYRSGFTVHTTLDPTLQDTAQEVVREKIDSLDDRHRVSNGALVAMEPSSGEILAMVGSANFNNEEIEGEINMALRPRQPGSAIKPLTYLASFEEGWTPATLIWDVPSEFPPSGDPNDPRPPYKPVNYDERFHGPVTVRDALANSYNVPAVKTLDFVGIYDDPSTPEEEGLVPFARRMGISTFNRDDYGLSLTLGGGEVTLRELTAAYATMANGGRQIPPVVITKIEDYQGNLVYEHQTPSGEQIIRPEHAFLISSILSDNEARTPAFGPNSVLNLPFQAAAKTGTTNDFRDNWTMGYTPDLSF
ncbi:MAG: transglycosylase domain-containing protein, partial [Anaerolineales bacterium]|nr:transglycosylase domain-containing protein [Anaerolineales bacterium]